MGIDLTAEIYTLDFLLCLSCYQILHFSLNLRRGRDFVEEDLLRYINIFEIQSIFFLQEDQNCPGLLYFDLKLNVCFLYTDWTKYQSETLSHQMAPHFQCQFCWSIQWFLSITPQTKCDYVAGNVLCMLRFREFMLVLPYCSVCCLCCYACWKWLLFSAENQCQRKGCKDGCGTIASWWEQTKSLLLASFESVLQTNVVQ